jgi:hypothetical protein
MNFSFDIEVIFDIGLLRYRSLLLYRSIFNIEVLRYRSINSSISKFCEKRDLSKSMDFDIEVRYRALYRSQNKVLRYRSLVSPIYGYTYIGVHASISKYMTLISKFGKVPDERAQLIPPAAGRLDSVASDSNSFEPPTPSASDLTLELDHWQYSI